MNNLIIQSAQKNDRDAIRAVTLEAYEEYAAMMPPQAWTGYRRSILATLAEDGPQEYLIARLNERIVGSVLLYPGVSQAYGETDKAEAYPEIRLLAVLPEMRGHGVGRVLVEACIERVRETGVGAIGLHTMDMMSSAQRLYLRMGFVHVPARDFQPAPDMVVKGYLLPLKSLSTNDALERS